MKPTNTTSGILRLFLFLTGIMIVLLGAGVPAAAQDQNYGFTTAHCVAMGESSCAVWGYSYFLAPPPANGSESTTAYEVWAHSETDVNVSGADVGSDAEVTGCLYNISQPDACYSFSNCSSSPAAGTCLVNGESNIDPDPWYEAWVDTSGYTSLGDSYEIDTDVAFDFCDGNGCQQYYYAWLVVQMSTGAPVISSISPSQVADGGSGIMTISGANLCDVFDSQSYQLDTSNIALSNWTPNSNCSSWTANYLVNNAASSGVFHLTYYTAFGQSTGSFSIVRPTPVITSVSPSTWTPGSGTFTVTINGRFYGPYLGLSGSVPGLAAWTSLGSPTEGVSGAIQLSVTMDSISSGGMGSINVVSYNDAGGDGPLTSAPYSITVPGNPGPAPVLNSVSPAQINEGNSATITINGVNYPGTTGTITVYGNNLLSGQGTIIGIDQGGCLAAGTCEMWITSVVSSSETQITADYDLLSFAPPGAYTVTVQNAAGQASIGFNVVTPVPVITSVSPNPWNIGNCSANIRIFGTFLGPVVTVAYYSDTVASFTFGNVSSTEIDGTVTFTSYAPGPQTPIYVISLNSVKEDPSDGLWSAPFGVAVTPFPIPVITGISGQPWDAGAQDLPFTINGTNFGSGPAVTITGTGIISYPISSTSNTAITGNITIDWAAPAGDAFVQVQAAGCPGDSSSVSSLASSVTSSASSAAPAKRSHASSSLTAMDTGPAGGFEFPISAYVATPWIAAGSDLAACSAGAGAGIPQTQVVTIGQKIGLVGCVALPQGSDLAVASGYWDVQGDVIGGYKPIPGQTFQQSAVVLPFANTNPLRFYWQDIPTATAPVGGSNYLYTVTYVATLNNGTPPASATANYNVYGPTSGPQGVQTTMGTVLAEWTSVNKITAQYLILLGMQAPDNQSKVGITFQAVGAEPAFNPGIYSWVQLINSDLVQVVDGTTGYRGSCTGGPSPGKPALDTSYPYELNPFIVYTTNVPNDTVVDAPNVNLPNQFGEVARSFNATMYSMWVPNADRNCNGNDGYSCTIPVPLGSVTWSLTGEAINTLNPVYQQNPGYGTSNWWLSCFYPTANGQEQPVFLQSNQYPGWTSVDSGQNCK